MFPGGRLLGPGARRFSDGTWYGEQAPQNLFERNQHHAGVHCDQHVSQAVGGLGTRLSGADRQADPVGTGAARRQKEESVQPIDNLAVIWTNRDKEGAVLGEIIFWIAFADVISMAGN